MKAIRRYRNARSKWFAAGQPERSDEDVTTIYETKCKPCEFYRHVGPSVGQCKLCKCALNLGSRLNKIRWATESCPIPEPDTKWRAQVFQDDKGEWVDVRTQTPDTKPAKLDTTRTSPDTSRRQRHEDRKQRREERRQRRREQRRLETQLDESSEKALLLGPIPPKQTYPRVVDNLNVYDRAGNRSDALRGHWQMCPVFIVCGGPSLNQIDLGLLKESAVNSIGVNNAGAYAPCKAMIFSDPQSKFHQACFLDPGIMTFAPRKHLNRRVRAKIDGKFHFTAYNVSDFPNVWGYDRVSELGLETWDPMQFFKANHATWGIGELAAKKLNRDSVRFTPLIAIRLAHYLGARRVYLLGVDLKMKPGLTGGYAWNQARTVGAAASNNAHYRRIATMFHELKPAFDAEGFEVFTCNPNTNSSAFEYVPYGDALDDCLKLMPEKPYDLAGWYAKDIRLGPMSED